MAESSFPVDGVAFDTNQFSYTQRANSGVLDDWGDPYNITVNTDDTVTIGVSATGTNRAIVAGLVHVMTEPISLTLPAVSSTTSYHIGLLYDPSLEASTPVTLQVVVTAYPSDLGTYLPLYTCVRASGQTLQAATWRDVRPRTAPHWTVASAASGILPNPSVSVLRGTTVHALDTGADLVADLVSGSKVWRRTNTITRSGITERTVASDGGTAITHGLGTTPDVVQITQMNTSNDDGASRIFRTVLWGAPGATTFNVRNIREDTNEWAGASKSRFAWTAIAGPE